jgi:hypothetical protein
MVEKWYLTMQPGRTMTESIVIAIMSLGLGIVILNRALHARDTGIVEVRGRYHRKVLEGDEQRDMQQQWLGAGILLFVNIASAMFFPLVALIIGVFLLMWIVSYEASAAS